MASPRKFFAATVGLVLLGSLTTSVDALASTARVPSITRAKVEKVTSASAALSWTFPSRRIKATVIRMALGSSAPRSVRSASAVTTVNRSRHALTVSHLRAATNYSFALFSTDGHGHYGKPAVVRVVTAPPAITRLRDSGTTDSIALTWANPATSTFRTIVVRYAGGTSAPLSPGSGIAARLGSARAASLTVSGLAPGSPYAFSLWARDSRGRYSPRATLRAATTPAPGAVRGLSYLDRAPSVVLAWADPSTGTVTTVRICRSDGTVNSSVAPANCVRIADLGAVRSYADSTVSAAATYTYWVTARDTHGALGPDARVVALAPPAPVAEISAAAGVNYTSAVLSWDSAGSGSAVVCRVAAGAPPPAPASCRAADDAEYVDDSVQPGHAYDYYVFAVGVNGAYSVGTSAGYTAPVPHGASIVGTVTSATDSTALAGVDVYVISPGTDTDDPRVLGRATTHADGTYAVADLTPNEAGADICVDAGSVTTPGAASGYVSQCHGDAGWDAQTSSPTGTTVPLTAAAVDTVDAGLTPGGAVSGTVTDAAGQAVPGVQVQVVGADGATGSEPDVYDADTDVDGRYRVAALPGGSYAVCFATANAAGPPTGYVDHCYTATAGAPPTARTPVDVTAGRTTDVDTVLIAGGEITGTVTDLASGDPLGSIDVMVFTADGDRIGDDITDTDGTYRVAGLPTDQDLLVCAAAEEEGGDAASPNHLDQCWRDTAWSLDAAPTGSAVTLAPGQSVGGVDLALDGVSASTSGSK